MHFSRYNLALYIHYQLFKSDNIDIEINKCEYLFYYHFLEFNTDNFLDNVEYCHIVYNVINCSHQPLGILIWWSKYKHIILLQRKGSCRFHHRFLSALLYFLRQKTSDTKHFYAQFLHHIA